MAAGLGEPYFWHSLSIYLVTVAAMHKQITMWVAAGTVIRPPFHKCHIVSNERSSCSGSYHSTQWNAGEIYIYDASRDRQWQRKVPGGRWCW